MELNEIIPKLADGNPGALNILIELVSDYPIPAITILTKCLELNIKGTNFYVLASDICEKEYRVMAYLCNRVSSELLIDASNRQDRSGKALLQPYIDKFYTD